MSRAARGLNRAIQITPSTDRDRYAREWRCDMSAAVELGLTPMEVARGASRVAWRLRVQRWGRTLSGAEGGGRAAVAWASVLASLPVLFLVGGILSPLVIPAAIVVALGLTRQGPSRASSVVMLGTAVLWLACTVVFWWLWNVGFDAADANQPLPAFMRWYEPSFVVGLGAFIAFWLAFVVRVIQITRTGRNVSSRS